jgi:hypothetical protein
MHEANLQKLSFTAELDKSIEEAHHLMSLRR